MEIPSIFESTGYGYHADYMMGWPEATLAQAMAQCTDYGGAVSSCSVLHSRSEQDMNDCAVPARVDEVVDGCECAGRDHHPDAWNLS